GAVGVGLVSGAIYVKRDMFYQAENSFLREDNRRDRFYTQPVGNILKIVAVNVAELRRQRGWTQETLAERADLSLTAIAHLETERRWPELTTIEKIAAALSVPA